MKEPTQKVKKSTSNPTVPLKKIKSHEASIIKKYAYMELPFFECDKGWNKLIENLCEAISVADKNKEVRVQQIKEKLSTLRFYINIPNPRIDKIIAKFEKASARTCEICGNEGHIKVLKDFPWYKTLCDRHAKKLGYIEIRKTPRQKSTIIFTDIKRDEDYDGNV